MKTPAKKRTAAELAAAVLWCALTLGTDRLFFRYDWRTPAFFVYKALFLALAFGLVHGAVTLVQKLRVGDKFARRWVAWTLPYLAVNLVILLIVWPGIWGNDDLAVLYLARTLQPNSWQHFLTSGAFILSLMFVPMPGGVVLVQNLLISGIVGCFAATAQDLAEKRLTRPVRPAWFALVYLPFLLPPVLMHTQQPFRTTWSTWTELFLVFMLVAMYLRGTKLNKKELAAIVMLGTLAASWRSECVYYLACSRYSSALMGEAWQYKMIALCYQTAALVQDADPVEDAEALADIDRVFDVEFCRANPETHGNELREGMLAGRGGSAEDWSACQKAIIKLALKYPKSMLRERAGVFYNTLRQRQNGQSNQKIAFASAFLLYEGEPTQDDQKSFLQDSAAVQPLNKELRRAFIADMASSTDFAGGLIDLTWWMLPPFVLLGLALAVLLVQRRWMLFFAAGTFFARIPLVFLTAPDTYFMYYLTPFIAGYAVAAAAVLYVVLKRKLKSERITG